MALALAGIAGAAFPEGRDAARARVPIPMRIFLNCMSWFDRCGTRENEA